MRTAQETTLLQVMNRRFQAHLYNEKSRSIAQRLGMTDEELALAEQRGFTREEAMKVEGAVRDLGFELRRYRR